MTPHIGAKLGEIAKTVIMPGDPKRAKFIAETYLENVKLVSEIRGIPAYTGKYKGKEVTIMASGMGMPSMGIYSYELYKFYDVDTIIRVGSCGAYQEDIDLYSVINVKSAYSTSSFGKVQSKDERDVLNSTEEIYQKIQQTANKTKKEILTGTIYSSDIFYYEDGACDINDLVQNHHCLAVEMESFALFHNADVLGKKAACILTVSDNIITHKETTPEEREKSFTNMIELALDSIE